MPSLRGLDFFSSSALVTKGSTCHALSNVYPVGCFRRSIKWVVSSGTCALGQGVGAHLTHKGKLGGSYACLGGGGGKTSENAQKRVPSQNGKKYRF